MQKKKEEKFKVGDRVVVLETAFYFREDFHDETTARIGNTYEVKEGAWKDSNGDFWYPLKGTYNKCRESELELESIYNSPLYKALL